MLATYQNVDIRVSWDGTVTIDWPITGRRTQEDLFPQPSIRRFAEENEPKMEERLKEYVLIGEFGGVLRKAWLTEERANKENARFRWAFSGKRWVTKADEEESNA
jgi:hypothetical protein